ncbi:hypothetical protein chiPu_0016607 [Chiloscyllium punctatum]|uniref:Uncharacterized protein n=1 Tax=Chiloscyllium punctatum TaxID=137246 RepID=A0A401T609_CHIPU|nr:hypothetical protein [Chiloscyllium punctatum]
MDNECDLEFRKNLEAERRKLDVERQMRKTYEAISQDAKEPLDDTCALTSPEEEEVQLPSFTKRQRQSYGKPDAARMYEIAQMHVTLPNVDDDIRRAFPKPAGYVDRYSPTQQTLRHHPYVGYTLGGRHYGSLPPDESHLSDDVIAANRQSTDIS